MLTVVELHRAASELQIRGHWRMNKAELEQVTGLKKEVPPHLPFLILLAMDYERYAEKQADIVRSLRYKLSTYNYESPRIEQMRRWLRTAELDVAEARERAAHYRCQAAR